MPTLIPLYVAGWDCILNDAGLLRRRNHCLHHSDIRNLMIKEASAVQTSDSSCSSSLGSGGTCMGVGQTAWLAGLGHHGAVQWKF